MTELKPKMTSFMFTRVFGAMLAGVMLAFPIAIAGAASETPLLAASSPLVLVGITLLALISARVAWTKERYEIGAHRLVSHSGGITSDRTTEVEVKNITHVKQHLGWIRYRFFNVGDVIVQSAGSSSAEIVLRAVRQPDEVYAQIRALMKDNGFSLAASQRLHSEQPAAIGAAIECASIGMGGVFFALWAFGGLAGAGAALGPWGLVAGALLGVFGGLGVFAFLGLHYIDLRRRTYEVYDDVVEYREGFLSRTNAFIPYENIADAATKQTFLDQILGLYDVKVSCQGSGAEVSFRRLAGGPRLQEVLRGRVDAAQALRERKHSERKNGAQAQSAPTGGEAPGRARSSRPPAEIVPASRAWTAELRMNTGRALLGGGLLRALGTTYNVGPSSVSSRYNLIGQQQLEFAYDKVTGVQVRTSPLDSVFGTFTVRIWSIGSSTPLDLAHVDRTSVNLRALLRQAGIPGGPARSSHDADFGLGAWLRANVGGAVLLVLLFPLLLVQAVSFPLLAMRTRRQRFTLHDHHIEHRAGIFWQRHTYARYDDIKKISVRRYAGTEMGSVTVFVAGETQLQTQKGKQGAIIPNAFTAHYLPDVTPFTRTLDPLLQGRLAPSEVSGGGGDPPGGPEFQPAVANSVVAVALIGLLFPPLWLVIPYTVMALRRRRYRVEAERAVIEEGILYRTHTSVLYDRIDSMEQKQGALGKAFGNGTVTLFTAGSSRPDLVLSNTPGYLELYQAIRARYGE